MFVNFALAWGSTFRRLLIHEDLAIQLAIARPMHGVLGIIFAASGF